jgi:hypothetical protein
MTPLCPQSAAAGLQGIGAAQHLERWTYGVRAYPSWPDRVLTGAYEPKTTAGRR